MKISVADFNIEIKNKFKFIEKQCEDYKADFDNADFVIETTDMDIESEKKRPFYQEAFKEPYLETVNVHRKLCFMLPEKDAIMLHSAAFSMGDRTIALVANSGVGKTTHMMHYKELFGDKVTIINGDKPIIRLIDSELFIYGTPWCGKEKMNTNTKAKLTDVCFINRSESNSTHPMKISDASSRIFSQIYLPKSKLAADNTLKMLDLILKKCNLWEINCTKDVFAAKASYATIFNKGDKNETKI